MSCGCEHNQPLRAIPARGRRLGHLGQTSSQTEVNRDLLSGAVAFGAPLAYHYAAPKKWPRLNTWQNVGAVIGLYFLSSYLYKRAVT